MKIIKFIINPKKSKTLLRSDTNESIISPFIAHNKKNHKHLKNISAFADLVENRNENIFNSAYLDKSPRFLIKIE